MNRVLASYRSMALGSVVLATLGMGCGDMSHNGTAMSDDGTATEPGEDTGTAQSTITVSGMGIYCNTNRSNGEWLLGWGSSGNPCQWLATDFPPAGTVKRKGIYALNAFNNVILTCTTNSSTTPHTKTTWGWQGWGEAPIGWAYDHAANYPNGSCTFTISPKELPILRKPYNGNDGFLGCSKFNYARNASVSAVLPDGSTMMSNTVINNRRQPLANGWDVGHDCALTRGDAIVAMAEGTVKFAGCWDTDDDKKTTENQTSSGTEANAGQQQKEVIIEHIVTGPSILYPERFYTLYAHLDTIAVTPGQWVSQGTTIGTAGDTGGAEGIHLHFMVDRSTNTVDQEYESYTVPTPNSIVTCGSTADSPVTGPPHNLNGMIIDPWGWQGPNMMDPWATGNVAYNTPTQTSPTAGGLSINLWIPGEAPGVAPDWQFTDGTHRIKTSASSFNRCMDVQSASVANGAQIQQNDCNGLDRQRWQFTKTRIETVPTGPDTSFSLSIYQIRNTNSGKCLEVENGSTASGAKVQQNTCVAGSARQEWGVRLVDWENAKLEINPQTVPGVTMCLDVDNMGSGNGVKLQQFGCNEGNAQRFKYAFDE